MEYIYPAVFHKNDDGSLTIVYPDLPGCISEGKDLSNALCMAQAALSEWIEFLADEKAQIPPPSEVEGIAAKRGEFVSLIRCELKDTRAVRRNVSIPSGWTKGLRNPA